MEKNQRNKALYGRMALQLQHQEGNAEKLFSFYVRNQSNLKSCSDIYLFIYFYILGQFPLRY